MKDPVGDKPTKKRAVLLDESDNVAVLLQDVHKGELCIIHKNDRDEVIEILEEITFGHKVALMAITKNEPVIKYGETIGKMKNTIEKGGWIHTHNMYCERGMGNV